MVGALLLRKEGTMTSLLWVAAIWIGAGFVLCGIYALWFFFFCEADDNKRIYHDEYCEKLKKGREKK
jgi:hypothetical protein